MKKETLNLDLRRLLRIAAILGLGYLASLAVIDLLLYPPQTFVLRYYVANGLNALMVLGLVLWAPMRLGRAFLPLVIILMSALPLLINHLLVRSLPPGPLTRPEAMVLRLLPVLLMALVLTAWQYRWRQVFFFSLGIAGLNLGLLAALFAPGSPPYVVGSTVTVIQTVVFLAVGYFISWLMTRLRAQQQSLEQVNLQLSHYASTLENLAISRERNRMARELHDTLAHTLSTLSVQLETVKAYWDVDPAAAQQILNKSLETTRSGLQETRRALKSLRASPLDDLGLRLAVHQLAESAASRGNLALELLLSEALPALSPDVEQCVYRVAQEAVANVVHHAGARTLTVRLTGADGRVSLLVRDDGRGFDPNGVPQPGHFGLAGMRERAQLVGGQLTITSRPERGTTIQLTV